MKTCFIFFDVLKYAPNADWPESFWAVSLDQSGEVDIALSEHTLEAIKSMQMNARTVIVLPAAVVSVHRLNLPKLSLRKAQEAVPYAIEESLAEPVQEVHVAFDRDEKQALHYRVVALNKLRLNTWIQALESLGLIFDEVTIDLFALNAGELCVTDSDVLVCEPESKDAVYGALSPSLGERYLKTRFGQMDSGFVFDDSFNLFPSLNFAQSSGSYRLFIAKRLLSQPFVNLCQGDFERTKKNKKNIYWYGACIGMACLWLFSLFGTQIFLLHQLRQQGTQLDQAIENSFRKFFPNATQVVNPRFRIEQLLKSNLHQQTSACLTLLDKLSQVFLKYPLAIEQIQYRDQKLLVHLIADNFATLENFEQQLKLLNVIVKQVEAISRGRQVVATLEIQE